MGTEQTLLEGEMFAFKLLVITHLKILGGENYT